MNDVDRIIGHLEATKEFLGKQISEINNRLEERNKLCMEHNGDIQILKKEASDARDLKDKIDVLEKFQIKLVSIYIAVTALGGFLYMVFGDKIKAMIP